MKIYVLFDTDLVILHTSRYIISLPLGRGLYSHSGLLPASL